MAFSKKNSLCLFLCLFIIILLCVAQVINSTPVVLLCFAIFMLTVVWASFKGIAAPVLLFFLPWSPLLKMAPGSMTVFTLALIVVCVVFLFQHGLKFDRGILSISVLLFVITIIVKLMNGYSIENSYILFMMLLILFPLVSKEVGIEYDFFELTVFFAMGIITAALSAQYLLVYPTISRYIVVHSFNKVTRLCGYYGDPNFYAAHITAVLSGILILLTVKNNRNHKNKIPFLILLFLVVLYCGLLSASKAFIIVLLCIFVIWILYVLSSKGKISKKIAVFFGVFLVLLFIVTSNIFTDIIDIILLRFNQSSGNVSDLTTGRSDIWVKYIKGIFSDFPQFLFGVGFTNVKYQNMGSHNTIIQMLYQFGIVGSTLFIIWMVLFVKRIAIFSKNHKRLLLMLALVIGCFEMWLSIDLLFFDELFLIPFYACMGINWISDHGTVAEVELQE